MPKPVYIVCSQQGVEDKTTGLLSLFNVIEKINLMRIDKTETPSPQASSPDASIWRPLPLLHIVAVWMKTDQDTPTEEFECEISLTIPPSNNKIVGFKSPFSFTKPLQRFVCDFVGPPFEGSGILTVESSVRKKDEKRWLTQSYPIILEEVFPKPQDPKPAP